MNGPNGVFYVVLSGNNMNCCFSSLYTTHAGSIQGVKLRCGVRSGW